MGRVLAVWIIQGWGLTVLGGDPAAPAGKAPAGESGELAPVPAVPAAAELLQELNLLREDPAGYAAHLEELIAHFNGNRLELPGEIPLRTQEGAAAVAEAIAELKDIRPRQALRLSEGMCRAAADHRADIGPRGDLEHKGSDGSTPSVRIRRYGSWQGRVGEALSFGERTARMVVLHLLVDDGVPDRSHRVTLLRPEFKFFGAACGLHTRYGVMCVLDFTTLFRDQEAQRQPD